LREEILQGSEVQKNTSESFNGRFLRFLGENRELVLACVLGFLVRIYFIPYLVSLTDMITWRNTGRSIVGGYVFNYFHTYLPYRYPPLWGYFCAVAYKITSLFVQGHIRATNIYFLTSVKMPLIISDIAIGIFLYRFVLEITRDRRQALLGSILFIFNPVAIYISANWAMHESLCLFFLVGAEYYMLKNRLGRSAVMGSLAILAKQFAYPYVLVLGVIVLRNLGWKRGVTYLATVGAIVGGASIPFLILDKEAYLDAMIYTNPIKWLRPAKGGFWGILHIGERWNLFYVPGFLGQVYFYVFYASFLFWVGFFLVKKIEITSRSLNDVMVMLSLTFLTLSPQIHTNYFFICIPFICLSVALKHHSPIWYVITALPISTWVYKLPFVEDPDHLWDMSFKTLNCLATFTGLFAVSTDLIESSIKTGSTGKVERPPQISDRRISLTQRLRNIAFRSSRT